MKPYIAACLVLALLVVSSAPQAADFRAYRANKRLQQDRIPLLNEDEPGCHNLLLKVTVYRVAQIGYEYCAVYSEKDCQAGREVQVTWKREKAPVTEFTQGDRWFVVSDDPQGSTVGSWYCEERD